MHSNDDDKAAYDANKQQVESLISQILSGVRSGFLGSALLYLGKLGEGAGSSAYRRMHDWPCHAYH